MPLRARASVRARTSCGNHPASVCGETAGTQRVFGVCGGLSLKQATVRGFFLNFNRRWSSETHAGGVMGSLTSSRTFFMPCLASTGASGNSAHLDPQLLSSLALQYASGLGPEPEKELALDTHHVRRSTWPSEGTTPRGSQGSCRLSPLQTQVQLHQSQMNDTTLPQNGAAARLHTVGRRTHGSFGSSRTCA